MKKILLIPVIIVILSLMGLNPSCAQQQYSFTKETFLFAEKQNEKLYLDTYLPIVKAEKTPCVIFVFGGAFARGARDVEKYIPYFDYLVRNGYSVVSIDYRLGLKDISQNKNAQLEEFVATFVNTVDMAVEDLFDATNFILRHAQEWNIDESRIITNGSSAGAVTVLQAEYAICNKLMSFDRLPQNFRYAGVIAFAGAILNLENRLEWKTRPCPVMMFHGDADLQVPYSKLEYENLGFYGAEYIAETLDEMDSPYYFYSFENYGHEIASDPMQNNREEVLAFLKTFVIKGEQLKINTELEKIGKEEVIKDFGIFDYIKGNFDR